MPRYNPIDTNNAPLNGWYVENGTRDVVFLANGNVVRRVSEDGTPEDRNGFFDYNDTSTSASPLSGSFPLKRAADGAGASDAWSFIVWTKSQSGQTSDRPIFLYGDDTSGAVVWMERDNTGSGEITFYMGDAAGGNYIQWVSNSGRYPAADQDWHQIAVTYSGASTASTGAGIVKIYFDGVDISGAGAWSTVGNGANAAIPGTDALRLGTRSAGNRRLRGNIDECSIWSAELSAANITNYYNGGTPTDLTGQSNLYNWWRMGDGDTFPTLTDNAGSDDLTLQNLTAGDIVNDVP